MSSLDVGRLKNDGLLLRRIAMRKLVVEWWWTRS
jgi:hypothetical protein